MILSRESTEEVSTTTPIDHEFEEMKWGLNMALIGDGHWKSFNIVEDIQNIVSRMERKVNLRVMGREGETLSRMYDETRESLICALPTKCYKVAISVGTYDLKDNSLITLKEASMEEVRRRNEPKLQAKANILRDLVSKLINQGKSVVVMVPPHGEERIELHHHWEEVLLATLRDIRFPKLRVLNMAQDIPGAPSIVVTNSIQFPGSCSSSEVPLKLGIKLSFSAIQIKLNVVVQPVVVITPLEGCCESSSIGKCGTLCDGSTTLLEISSNHFFVIQCDFSLSIWHLYDRELVESPDVGCDGKTSSWVMVCCDLKRSISVRCHNGPHSWPVESQFVGASLGLHIYSEYFSSVLINFSVYVHFVWFGLICMELGFHGSLIEAEEVQSAHHWITSKLVQNRAGVDCHLGFGIQFQLRWVSSIADGAVIFVVDYLISLDLSQEMTFMFASSVFVTSLQINLNILALARVEVDVEFVMVTASINFACSMSQESN